MEGSNVMNSVTRNLVVVAFTAVTALSWSVTAKLCIDAGHGGSDSGATGCGQLEDTNNLNTALKFRTWLNADTNDGGGGGSWSVVMTRTTDVAVSLQGRCDISNNNACNRFLCNHNNACCGGTGTETFSYTGTGTGATMRNQIQSRLIQAWGLTNRGNKTANFYVLVNTSAPATLAELGFIDNCSIDANYVGNAAKQDLAAKYMLYAIQNHYGITAYTPGAAATYIVDNANGGFSCSANWSTGSSSTDKYGADYRYRSTAAVSDAANFAASVAAGGSYTIYAWWPAGTNRSTTAPYILPNGTTVNVNQQANGGKWNSLGTASLSAGSNTTKLSCWTGTGFIVVADAVKLVGPN
jgi:N-acetylmuramoyl-L-alanine amidase